MNNPLSGYIRQPKIYIKLPSNGKFWPEGSLEMSDTGELPVYSMTAVDEITLKTPDALLNGQAVVNVIQSCVPNIKNAWDTPNIDIDTILVAIRIASYGEMMEISHIVPGTKEEVEYTIDLRRILEQLLNNSKWEDTVVVDNQITCIVNPLTYRHVSKNSLKTFEAQRMISLVGDSDVPEEQRIEILKESVDVLSTIAFDVILDSIHSVIAGDIVVTEKEFIKEFLQNADRTTFDKVQEHLTRMKACSGIAPLEFNSSQEHIEMGAPATYSMPLNMDYSNFFAVRS